MARAQRAGRVIVASSRDQATSLAALRAREANTPASVIAVAPITVKNAIPEASRYVDCVAFGWTLLRSYSATRYAVYAWDVSALLIGIERASSVTSDCRRHAHRCHDGQTGDGENRREHSRKHY